MVLFHVQRLDANIAFLRYDFFYREIGTMDEVRAQLGAV